MTKPDGDLVNSYQRYKSKPAKLDDRALAHLSKMDKCQNARQRRIEHRRRAEFEHAFDDLLAQSWKGDVRPLCEHLRSSGDHVVTALAEFIERRLAPQAGRGRKRGIIVKPGSSEEMERTIIRLARPRIARLRHANGGKLHRGELYRVLDQVGKVIERNGGDIVGDHDIDVGRIVSALRRGTLS